MTTIVVANQKGGVGKTTVARHLAWYGERKKLKTLAVDLDIQGNFTTTWRNVAVANGFSGEDGLESSQIFDRAAHGKRPAKASEYIDFVAADRNILAVERNDVFEMVTIGKETFLEFNRDYDLVVIDTGPSVSNLLVMALAVADFAVSPCKPDRDAIQGLLGFFSNVVRVRDELALNGHLAPLGVLPNQLKRDRAWHRQVLSEMQEAFSEVMLGAELCERAATDIAKDQPVWMTSSGTSSKSVAAREMLDVCEHVFSRMGL